MIEQAELNRAFFARYGEPSRAELFGRHGEPSRAELFCPKARAKTEPSLGSDPTLVPTPLLVKLRKSFQLK